MTTTFNLLSARGVGCPTIMTPVGHATGGVSSRGNEDTEPTVERRNTSPATLGGSGSVYGSTSSAQQPATAPTGAVPRGHVNLRPNEPGFGSVAPAASSPEPGGNEVRTHEYAEMSQDALNQGAANPPGEEPAIVPEPVVDLSDVDMELDDSYLKIISSREPSPAHPEPAAQPGPHFYSGAKPNLPFGPPPSRSPPKAGSPTVGDTVQSTHSDQPLPTSSG